MNLQEQIKSCARRAQQFARVADQLRAIDPIIRTAADRSGNSEQTDAYSDIDCDIKLPSMILVSGLDMPIAKIALGSLIAAHREIAEMFERYAETELRDFESGKEMVDLKKVTEDQSDDTQQS